MNNREFLQMLSEDVYKKIVRGIALMSALRLSQKDPVLFQMRVWQMCCSVLSPLEHGGDSLQYILDETQFIVSTKGDIVIFRYNHLLHEYAAFVHQRRTPHVSYAGMTSTCWLLPTESPAQALPFEMWCLIATHLSVDDKRTLALVSRGFNETFSANLTWKLELNRIRPSITVESFSRLSYKQQVLRYLLYCSNPTQFVRILYSEMGSTFARNLYLGLFKDGPVRVQINDSNEYHLAKLAIGYRTPNNIVRPNIWVDTTWTLRYQNDQTAAEIWTHVYADIVGYRRRILY